MADVARTTHPDYLFRTNPERLDFFIKYSRDSAREE
jgi:hypothetical protein